VVTIMVSGLLFSKESSDRSESDAPAWARTLESHSKQTTDLNVGRQARMGES